ncbi:MAG: hypothetical protein ACFB21_05165 [Opitutales bacterium]
MEDMITHAPTASEILQLAKAQGGTRISIYLPLAKAADRSDENRIHAKNLYRAAEAELHARGVRDGNTDSWLKPLAELLEDPHNLLRPQASLALFIDAEGSALYDLPQSVEPSVTVGSRYFLKPLVPLLNGDIAFVTVSLELERCRVYESLSSGLREINVPDLPQKITDITWRDDPEKMLQHHTANQVSVPGAPGQAPGQIFHGQGSSKDYEEIQVERYLLSVAKTLETFLTDDSRSVFVFAESRNLGHLKNHFNLPRKDIHYMEFDPRDLKESDLDERCRKALHEKVAREREDFTKRLDAARNGDAVFDLSAAAVAAGQGRLDGALIAEDYEARGICDAEQGVVTLLKDDAKAEEEDCAHDLLDLIAQETLAHGGRVFSAPSVEIPGGGPVAALRRF